jgi:hypothetical protein
MLLLLFSVVRTKKTNCNSRKYRKSEIDFVDHSPYTKNKNVKTKKTKIENYFLHINSLSSNKRPAATSSLIEAKKKTVSAAAAKTAKTVAKPGAKVKAALQKKEAKPTAKKVQKVDEDDYLSVTADAEDGAEGEWMNGDEDGEEMEGDEGDQPAAGDEEADDDEDGDEEQQKKKTISVTCTHCHFTGNNFWVSLFVFFCGICA